MLETCYLYFMGMQREHTDLYKMGISVNPVQRLSTFRTANPFEVYLLDAVPFQGKTKQQAKKYATSKEQQLHAIFDDCSYNGEWFSLTPAQLKKAVKIAKTE